MYTHIVTLVKNRLIRARELFDPHSGNVFSVWLYDMPPMTCEDSSEPDEITDAMTWFFPNEQQAEMFARHISTVHPGWEVFVCETKTIVATEPAVPVVKKVTERGVIPE